jgi:hypothetical protein
VLRVFAKSGEALGSPLLLHNPLLLPEFSALLRKRGPSEDERPDDYARNAGRIMPFHKRLRSGCPLSGRRNENGGNRQFDVAPQA